jgi:hypothetical protein
MTIAQDHRRLSSEYARRQPSDGGLTRTVGGFPRQVFAPVLDGRFNGPAWGITVHHRWRSPGDVCGQERLGTRGAGTIVDVPASDLNPIRPDAGPVSRARDDLEVSGAAPIPGHRARGALGRLGDQLVRGRECRALHRRASPGAGGARGGRRRQGRIAIKRADQGEMTAVWATTSSGLAGAVAGIPHHDDLALGKPAYPAGPPQPGPRGRRLMARRLGLSPCRATVSGEHHRECPGPDRARPLHPHRHDDPRVPPPRRRIAGGGAPTIAMAPRAEDVGARALCDRIIAGPPHRSCRHHIGQQQGQPPAGQFPCRPAALRTYPMSGGGRPCGVMAHGPYDGGDGLAASRHEGSEPQDKAPVRRGGGERRLKRTPSWHRNVWDRHLLSRAWEGRLGHRSWPTMAP